jgi:dTDP-4-dehydrorhamnose 3,5-epimerase
MRFNETALHGATLIEVEPHADSRGFFTRVWCERDFAGNGIPARFVQASLSHNLRRGTVRGMHLQLPPSKEGKLVRCIRGAIHDVIIDVRPDSPTYLRHFGVRLDAGRYNALYVPPLMLHGFQTLTDDCDVWYEMTDVYAPELGFGARWDDPAFGIEWPIRDGVVIVERDASYPDFDSNAFLSRARAAQAAAAS